MPHSDAASLPVSGVPGTRTGDPATSVMAAVALCQPGGISMITTPALLAAFAADGRFPARVAATFGSVELAGMTVAILVTSAIVAGINRRTYALLAFCISILGQLGTLFAAARVDHFLMLAARAVAGLGEGALTGVAVAAIAGLNRPDRGFGLAIPGNLVGSAIVFALMPRIMTAGGLPLLLGIIIAYSVLLGLFVPLFPRYPAAASLIAPTRRLHSMTSLLPALLALLGTMLFLTGIGTVWPITAQIGQLNGVSAAIVASTLSAASLAGAGAGLVAAWLGGRYRRQPLLVLGTAGVAITMLATGAQLGSIGFAICAVSLMLWWVFSITFYFATLATMDVSGRLVAFSTALQTFGLGLGQAVAAVIGGGSSLRMVTGTGAALVAAAGLVLQVATRLERRAPHLRSSEKPID